MLEAEQKEELISFLDSELERRVAIVASRLKGRLSGSTLLKIDGIDRSYVFEWNAENPVCRLAGDEEQGDSAVLVSAENLYGILKGYKNPQLLLAVGDIKVVGKLDHAIYLFNLFDKHL